MTEIKVIETKFWEYSNSIIVEYRNESEKKVYDIRVKFIDMEVSISGYGLKTGRQRDFRYSNIDSYEYRGLNSEDRKVYEQNYYKNNIPKEVANLALDEFIKSIKVSRF